MNWSHVRVLQADRAPIGIPSRRSGTPNEAVQRPIICTSVNMYLGSASTSALAVEPRQAHDRRDPTERVNTPGLDTATE